ncbi:ATP-binding protein [Streptosporangium fragile]|uniref:ATP-binding protein n=1 Tax=Streptosporangium fragile TaxID=46186 RepID=A0ABN3VZR6_9ACTN
MTTTHDDVAPELIDAMVRLRPGGMTWRRTFPGRPDQVPEARRFVRFLLADSPVRDDAEQVAAELAANAVRHTASGQARGTFIVEVLRRATATRVTVYDCGWGPTPSFTRRDRPDALGEDGRGLPLVAALASQVGYRGSQALGHAVWALFAAGEPR